MQIVEEIKQFKLWKNFLFLSKTDGIYVLLKSESLYKVFNYKNPFITLHEKYLHISNSNEENEQEFLIDSDLNVKEKYSSDLDTGFKMIYTKNVPDVVFSIGRVTYLERDYIKEFMNIFS